ncbi:hypothetical protein J2S80_000063 [Pseudoxanthomonas mexicana]|nr:hypothetical protein [Pseudoxanthomonas mexicana]
MIAMRKLAADIQNAHLARQGYVVRVDHRSLREQGRLRAPERHLGPGRVRRMSGTERAEYTATRDSGWPKPRADSPGEAHSRPHESDGRPWGG